MESMIVGVGSGLGGRGKRWVVGAGVDLARMRP
jgi:hypothetical protein